MIKNEYSLPLTDPAFDPMSWASIFWMLDLRFTYHLVPICKGDEWKTAFNNLSPFWVFGDFFFGGWQMILLFFRLILMMFCMRCSTNLYLFVLIYACFFLRLWITIIMHLVCFFSFSSSWRISLISKPRSVNSILLLAVSRDEVNSSLPKRAPEVSWIYQLIIDSSEIAVKWLPL